MKKLLAALAAALSLTFAFAPAMADVVTNNVVSGPYTQSTITNAVTANAAAQSILVGSSAGAYVGGVVIVGGLFPEMTTVTAVADSTHVTAIFRSNHEAGAAISFGGLLSTGCGYNSIPSSLTSGNLGQCQADVLGSILVQDDATNIFPAIGTAPFSTNACTSMFVGSRLVINLISETLSNQPLATVIGMYDEGASPTCAANDLLYQEPGMGAGQVVPIRYLTKNGLALLWSAAPTTPGVRVSTRP